MVSVIVCGGRFAYQRARGECAEKDDARLVIAHDWSPYYGETVHCECGDVYSEDGRMPRPFTRYWRRDRQSAFERMWGQASDERPQRCPSCWYLDCSGDCGELM